MLLKRQQERKESPKDEIHALEVEPIIDDIYVDKRSRAVDMDKIDEELDSIFVE